MWFYRCQEQFSGEHWNGGENGARDVIDLDFIQLKGHANVCKSSTRHKPTHLVEVVDEFDIYIEGLSLRGSIFYVAVAQKYQKIKACSFFKRNSFIN